MPWFKVDDGFYTSKKVLSIPRAQRLSAVGLWTMAGNWSARELSDGVVQKYVLDELGATPKLRQALIEARLWLDRGSGDIEFHDWAQYQPTRAEVEAAREKERIRKANYRSSHRDTHGTDGGTPAGRDAESHRASGHPVPTRPDPSRPDPSEELLSVAEATDATGTLLPDGWTPKQKHYDFATSIGSDLNRERDSFIRHAHQNKRRMKNWDAGFTNWLKKGAVMAQQRTNTGTAVVRNRADQRLERNLALVASLEGQ